jgi:hypothetical protein
MTIDIEPETIDIALKQGDSFPDWSFEVADETCKLIDLTGTEVFMPLVSLKTKLVAKTLTHTNGFTVTSKEISFDWQNIVNDLPVGNYRHIIRVKLPNGLTRTIYSGAVTIF